ncbi:MAG: sulfide/dihydroorotate dehydrogenase-like FAD/NAD-binding protein [Hyphomonadaceae bacterium]|nr:sulfide/dihydroorotate dehydrogenase-like FAD/NAD-binding protein [Clostridia bacterium]
MYNILNKNILNSQVTLLEIKAPLIAKKAKPGQFIILRVDENGERIPLTIANFDRDKGTITIIFQTVGKTTLALSMLEIGDALLDLVGPLGVPTHLDGIKKAAVIGGGLGTAIAYPITKKLFEMGAEVHTIVGFRNKDLIILQDEMQAISTNLYVTTDDGSNGNQGFVTNVLKDLIEGGHEFDTVFAIGPLVMMKAVSALTKQFDVKTIVSMNTIMIDGTGMCGGCRLTVGGETKFTCVDGPDFDGHLVDFDQAIARQRMFKAHEKTANDQHICRLGGNDNA